MGWEAGWIDSRRRRAVAEGQRGDYVATCSGSLFRVLVASLLAVGCGGSSGGTAPLTINSGSLPNGATGGAYSATLSASGGVTPVTWSRDRSLAARFVAGPIRDVDGHACDCRNLFLHGHGRRSAYSVGAS